MKHPLLAAGLLVAGLMLSSCAVGRLVRTPVLPVQPTNSYLVDLYHGSSPLTVQVGDIVIFDLARPFGGSWQLLSNPAPVLVSDYNNFTFRATAVGSEVVSFASAPGKQAAHNGNFSLRVNVLPVVNHLPNWH